MIHRIDEEKKIVFIFLTALESYDKKLKARLDKFYPVCKRAGYTVAVFENGSGDLMKGARKWLWTQENNKSRVLTAAEKEFVNGKETLDDLERSILQCIKANQRTGEH